MDIVIFIGLTDYPLVISLTLSANQRDPLFSINPPRGSGSTTLRGSYNRVSTTVLEFITLVTLIIYLL
jgi:hypothetical protein